MSQQLSTDRLHQNAGIAIGPILFIIAILAILAAAIAAGSGSFTGGTAAESAKTQASALIQIGENLKIGTDRIVMLNTISSTGATGPTVLNTVTTATSSLNDLFSPTGGGISAPSIAMANNPATDKWFFVQGPISGLGTGADNLFAVLRVSPTTCAAINSTVVGVNSAPTGEDLGNFASSATVTANTVTNWALMATPPMTGVATGCVNNTNAGSTGYYYYQVLAIN